MSDAPAPLLKRLGLAGAALALSLAAGGALLETYFRTLSPPRDEGARVLVPDAAYGWDATPSIKPLPANRGGEAVYFVGDSFTQNNAWPELVQAALARQGRAIDGYNLGVSGFGTVQEFLKVRATFDLHRPAWLVLLFFAFNDMRDNFDRPPIYYTPEMRHRGTLAAPAASAPWWESTQLFRRVYVRLEHFVGKRIARYAGLDAITAHDLPLQLDYTLVDSWAPFYEPARASAYREGCWEATERAFVALAALAHDRGAHLLVVGIDNAFTVDADVRDQWVTPIGRPLDLEEPLRRLAGLLAAHAIPFVSALPALREASRRTGRKLYLGPAGNLSGHFTPEAEAEVAAVTAAALARQMTEVRRCSCRASCRTRCGRA